MAEPKRPKIEDPRDRTQNPPEIDPQTHEIPERDPRPSHPAELPPDPERDPDIAGHDIEVEGP